MDADAAFAEIRKEISEGRGAQIGPRVLSLAESDSDPMTRIKCLSLLKVIDVSGVSKEILRMLLEDLPEDRTTLVQVAGALRGLEYPSSALSILKEMDQDDSIVRMSALCLIDLDEYEEALAMTEKIQEVTPFDRVMLTEIKSALGMHSEAVDIATKLLEEYPQNYEVRRAYVSALMLGGRDKEAAKYARAAVKDKTADSNALAAYVLRIAGNYKAAAGYATRALNIDSGHIGAMETLGICLADKGE